MQISFFEEFPTSENLSKLALVKGKKRVFVAAKSFQEFQQKCAIVKKKQSVEWVYWPIVERKEGYWISPFTKRSALLRIFNEIEGKNVRVMVDAELPTTKNPFLYVTQLLNFFRNRKLIREFIRERKDVYTAEYYPTGKVMKAVMTFLGLHFDPRIYGNNIIKMMYHSMHKFDVKEVRTRLREGRAWWGKRFMVGYGTIAMGIEGNEKILSRSQLRSDLKLAAEAEIAEVIIFRLGGLNKKYSKLFNLK